MQNFNLANPNELCFVNFDIKNTNTTLSVEQIYRVRSLYNSTNITK